MSQHPSFADEMAALYPPNAASDRDNHINRVLDGLDAVLKEHKGPLTAKQKYEIILAAGYSVGMRGQKAQVFIARTLERSLGVDVWMRGQKAQVFIASPIAPELDAWVEFDDDPIVEKQRSLDADWES